MGTTLGTITREVKFFLEVLKLNFQCNCVYVFESKRFLLLYLIDYIIIFGNFEIDLKFAADLVKKFFILKFRDLYIHQSSYIETVRRLYSKY